MKLTPLDIRHKEFKRGMRGYADVEVDEFLDEVADEYERLFKENIDFRDRVETLEEKVAGYQRIEETLQKTLVNAQASAEEQKQNAAKEAQLILQDAELKARQMINEAYTERQALEQSMAKLQSAREDFRFKFRQLLDGYLEQLGGAPASRAAAPEVDFARQAEAIKEAIARETVTPPAAPAAAVRAEPDAVAPDTTAAQPAAPARPAEPAPPLGAVRAAEPTPPVAAAAPPEPAPPRAVSAPADDVAVTTRRGVEGGRRRTPDDPEVTMSHGPAEPAGQGEDPAAFGGERASAGHVPADEAPEPEPARERILFGESDDLLADVDSGVNENEFKW